MSGWPAFPFIIQSWGFGFVVIDVTKDAAKLTCFVGEGDDFYNGDYLAFNDTKLWDGTNTGGSSEMSPNDVWNETSLGMSAGGVDVDTFVVEWDDGLQTIPIAKPNPRVAQSPQTILISGLTGSIDDRE